DNNWVF
nr:immunoglobulin light chain junction region [Macaca mulatta]